MFLILILAGSFSVKQEALSYASGDEIGTGRIYSSCILKDSQCNQLGNAINYSLKVFLAMILWMVSPVGLLFFLASGVLLSKRSSKLKRAIGWILQILALFVWISFMTILFILFIDSVTWNAFRFGGTFLDTAIVSGMAFFIVMFIYALYEMNIERQGNVFSENNGIFGDKMDKKSSVNGGNDHCAWIDKIGLGEIKNKVRRKVKDGLKEIIDDEIERRL